MTTLPQTTTVRLPRPNGTGQLAPTNGAAVPALAGAAQGGAGGGMSTSDVWRVIRGNVWIILGLLALSIVGGYVAFKVLVARCPRYTAEGYVSVQPINPYSNHDSIMGDRTNPDTGMIALEQRTQAASLKADALIMRVLQTKDAKIRETSWWKKWGGNLELAKEDFFDKYVVTPYPETKLIKITFTWADPKECKMIVEEVVSKAIEEQRSQVYSANQQRNMELIALRDKYRAKQAENESKITRLRTLLNIDGGSTGGVGQVGIKQMQLERMIGDQSFLEAKYKEADSRRQLAVQTINEGRELPDVLERITMDPDLRMLKNQQQLLELQLEQARTRYGDRSIMMLNVQAQLDKVRQNIEDTTAQLGASYRTVVMDKINNDVASWKSQYDQAVARTDEMKQSLGELSNKMASYLLALEDDKGVREMLEQITKQLDQLSTSLEKSIQSKMKWENMPEVPTSRSFPRLTTVMVVSVILGLGLGLGFAFLRELTDTTIKSPRDIQRVGQMTLLGMVQDENDDPQAAGARLPLVIFDAPHSMTAEQLRQVRTRLQHAASLDTTRSIMVTSPGPGDGKTTLAVNLAAGLALNGRRILLVDSNFRRPEVHKIFAVGNDQGFSDVLNGAIAFDEVVQETQVPNLAIMTSGPKPINATEMFESQLLIDFIERALEEFDHVIFDTGPMLVVSEAAAMAPRVDGVVSVVRARGNTRGLLERMRDELRKIKAEHLGVVLNAVRAQGGGYYGRNIKTYYEYQNA